MFTLIQFLFLPTCKQCTRRNSLSTTLLIVVVVQNYYLFSEIIINMQWVNNFNCKRYFKKVTFSYHRVKM